LREIVETEAALASDARRAASTPSGVEPDYLPKI